MTDSRRPGGQLVRRGRGGGGGGGGRCPWLRIGVGGEGALGGGGYKEQQDQHQAQGRQKPHRGMCLWHWGCVMFFTTSRGVRDAAASSSSSLCPWWPRSSSSSISVLLRSLLLKRSLLVLKGWMAAVGDSVSWDKPCFVFRRSNLNISPGPIGLWLADHQPGGIRTWTLCADAGIALEPMNVPVWWPGRLIRRIHLLRKLK